MRLVLASGNKGKLREFQAMFDGIDVIPFGEIVEPFEIVEDGDTFAQNALIKARAVYDALDNKGEYIVIADDSGISVPALGGEPGIYSARYAGEGASDVDNLNKLINSLKTRAIKRTPAYYTAALAIVSDKREYVVHGWMYGDVIRQARGDKGFGYDPMFIPYRGLTSDDMSARRADLSSAGLTPLMMTFDDKTLGELDDDIKSTISHRAKALELAKPIINKIKSSQLSVSSD